MKKTLILTEDRNEKSANIIATIISHTKIKEIGDTFDIKKYDNIVLIVSMENILNDFIRANGDRNIFSELLINLKVNCFDKTFKLGILFESNQISKIEQVVKMLKESVLIADDYVFINRDVANDAVLSGLELRDSLFTTYKQFDRDKLKEIIEDISINHKVMSLSSSTNDITRTTPIEYMYIDGNYYVITEGGLKFANIYINDKVSFSINDEFTTMNKVLGVQCDGIASVIDMYSEEYYKIMSTKGISKENLNNLVINLYLIKIVPKNYTILNYEFKKEGYDFYQYLSL
ncbi:hypothetical protein [Peptostreptococcus canis]|uniref:Pyridoxamine 5'-phosphate oxidase putative domain-containing protein n=1 Tax=Peptostreptococcus canis TaxID=1159213 RepID=A0ABR6TLZ5_9FIRM|nr:hypothetical protein [Peptostreptococcus canis]MBC2576436.1 hypothetical protein [Peptostreptococcus canis]MBP1998411.1 hypothetical protein [Peptostreptococcus canis]